MALTKTQVAMLEASGTPDNTTFLRGDGSWAAPSGGSSGGFSNWQIFTSSGTFTVPTGVTKVKVTVVGGGGGGGGANSGTFTAGGGGGGGAAIEIISGLTSGGTVSVTVGAAGTAGASSGTAGGTGGTSSFGAYCSATGGGGGGGQNQGSPSIGTGGSGSGGDLNMKGGDGGPWGVSSGMGIGGNSLLAGTAISVWTGGGMTGHAYGGGGSGTYEPNDGGASAGAAGAAGVVIVEY